MWCHSGGYQLVKSSQVVLIYESVHIKGAVFAPFDQSQTRTSLPGRCTKVKMEPSSRHWNPEGRPEVTSITPNPASIESTAINLWLDFSVLFQWASFPNPESTAWTHHHILYCTCHFVPLCWPMKNNKLTVVVGLVLIRENVLTVSFN